jgi:hypothetical protein
MGRARHTLALSEASASFLKKRSKKLSFIAGRGNESATTRSKWKFFCFFFFKKRSAFATDRPVPDCFVGFASGR